MDRRLLFDRPAEGIASNALGEVLRICQGCQQH